MNVGSLFSGIGGFDLGLERAGLHTAWFCEQDPYCTRVLNRHWPGIPVYPDVVELRGCDVASIDVLCGGFPCQDISTAGKGAGIRGERSGLWSEFARLIGELEPGWVIVENVSALLGRGLSVVLADLSTLGYDAEWDCLPASAFGAPHRRDRIWIVAYPRSEGSGAVPGGAYGRELDAAGCGADVADTFRERQQQSEGIPVSGSRRTGNGGKAGGRDSLADPQELPQREPSDETVPVTTGREARQIAGGGGWWSVEPNVGRVADGIPSRVDRLSCLGNALVPQIAEWIGHRIMSFEEAGE